MAQLRRPQLARGPRGGGSSPARSSSVRRAIRLRSLGWTAAASSRVELGVERLRAALGDLALDLVADLRRHRRAQLDVGQRRAQVEAGAADDDRAPACGEQGVDLGVGQLGEAPGAELARRRRRTRAGGARAARAPRRSPRRSGARARGRPGSRRRRRRPGPRRARAGARRRRSRRRSCRPRWGRRARGASRRRSGGPRRAAARWPASVVEVAPVISTSTSSPGAAVPSKLTVLLWRVRPRSLVGSVRLGPSTRTSIVRPTKRCARSRARRWTSSTSRSIRSRLTGCGSWSGQVGGLGPAARREDEREGAVVADLLDDLERLGEVRLGLAREADDDVGGERAVGHVLADQRDAVHVALAVVGAAHRLQHPARARLQRQVDVLAERAAARRGRGSRPRACPWGAGSCSGCARCRRPRRRAPAARRSGSAARAAGRARSCSRSGRAASPRERRRRRGARPRRSARRGRGSTSRPRVEGTMQ